MGGKAGDECKKVVAGRCEQAGEDDAGLVDEVMKNKEQ